MPCPTAISCWKRWRRRRIAAVHLSRFAEEIVIWTSPLVGFLALSDKFTTGSSIMPQKRNPDAAELVRAKAGRIIGALDALLIVMKGLPLAYQKDMQEDKEGAIDALARAGALPCRHDRHGARHDAPTRRACGRRPASGHATATDLADWLVRTPEHAVPRRPPRHRPHRRGGRDRPGVALDRLPLPAMQAIEPRITMAVFKVLSVEHSVASRTSFGGTAPKNVRNERANGWRDSAGRRNSA